MAEPVYDLTITNGTLATHETSEAVNIAITDGRFAALGDVVPIRVASISTPPVSPSCPASSTRKFISANQALSIRKICNRVRWPRSWAG